MYYYICNLNIKFSKKEFGIALYTQPTLVANIQRNHHHNTAKRLKPSCLNPNYPNYLKDLTNRYLLYSTI